MKFFYCFLFTSIKDEITSIINSSIEKLLVHSFIILQNGNRSPLAQIVGSKYWEKSKREKKGRRQKKNNEQHILPASKRHIVMLLHRENVDVWTEKSLSGKFPFLPIFHFTSTSNTTSIKRITENIKFLNLASGLLSRRSSSVHLPIIFRFVFVCFSSFFSFFYPTYLHIIISVKCETNVEAPAFRPASSSSQ